jgi:predicted Zn-dependent protease
MDRVPLLKEILAQAPGNTLARYGLAMEYSRAGDIAAALGEFRALLEKDPAYVPGYQMAAQMLVAAERGAEARPFLERGISEARSTGNQHAAAEMEALLDEISR